MADTLAPPPGFTEDVGPPAGFTEDISPASGPTKIDLHYLTPQDRISNAVEGVTGSSMAGTAAGMAIKSALPVAGSIIGLSIAGIPGEAIGSGLGEAANQGLGISEPSLAQIGLAMAAGPVTRGVMGVGKTLVGAAMKAGGGRQTIAEIAEGLTAKLFNPITSSDDLFAAAARKGNVAIPAVNTAQAITNTLRTEARRADTPIKQSIQRALEPLQKFYQPMPGVASTHSASEIATEAKRLRLMSTEAFKGGNTDLGHALSNVRNSMFDDAARSGVPELRTAATTYRREAAVEELQGILRQANPLKAYKDLQVKNALFKNVFNDSEQVQIKNILKKMSTVTPSGFSGVAGRAIATVAGQQAGGVAGGIAGFIAPEMAAGVVATKAGRNLMEKLLVGGTWDAPRAAALGQFWRAQMAQDATSGNIAEQVRQALKSSEVSTDDKIAAAAYQQGIKQAAKTEPSQSWGLGIEIDRMLRKIQDDFEKKE